jgi:hypothetical protein
MRHGIRRSQLPKLLLVRAKVPIEFLRCMCRLLAKRDRHIFMPDRRFRGEAEAHGRVASTVSISCAVPAFIRIGGRPRTLSLQKGKRIEREVIRQTAVLALTPKGWVTQARALRGVWLAYAL